MPSTTLFKKQDLSVIRGDTIVIPVEADHDLQNRLLTFTAKVDIGDTDEQAILQKTTQVTTTGNSYGFLLLPSESHLLNNRYVYDIQSVGNINDVRTIQMGLVRIIQDVTRTVPLEADPVGDGSTEVFSIEEDNFEIT